MKRGIRNKILYGFAILACLLFLSGLISYVEISHFGRDIRTSMDTRLKSIETAALMLESVQEQNSAVQRTVYGFGEGAHYEIAAARGEFQRLLGQMEANTDSIAAAATRYNSTVDSLFAAPPVEDSMRVDTDYRVWFETAYKTDYDALACALKSIMIRTGAQVDTEAAHFHGQAYRAGMPGIITLAVSILIIVVFFLLINFYYIAPVLRMTRSLGSYLDHKTPFDVKIEGRDEVDRLKEYITELITIIRKKEQQ